MRVNKSELVEILGVSHVSLSAWQAQGMPIACERAMRGQSHEYDTEACIRWWISREVDRARGIGETPQGRLYRLQADKIELEIDEKIACLADAGAVESVWQAQIDAARAYLGSRAAEIAGAVEGMGPDDCRNTLAEIFDELLRSVSALTQERLDDQDAVP